MKAIALNKESLSVVHAASKDQTRCNINGIHVEPGYVVASTGQWLARVSLPKVEIIDLPVESPIHAQAETSDKFTIPLDIAKGMAKAIPKQTYPIFQNVFVNANCNKASLLIHDGLNVVQSQFNLVDAEFPEYRQVLPAEEKKPQSTVHLNPRIMSDLCEAFIQFNSGKKIQPSMKIEVWGEMDQIRITSTSPNDLGQEFLAIVMPMKLPKKEGGKVMTQLTKDQTHTHVRLFRKDGKEHRIVATVRYDDRLGNGHNTFSITGEIYEGRQKEPYTFGCIHDEIAKYFKDLRPFIKWHLTSSDGPMHYVENTLYHAKTGDFKAARSTAIWEDMPISLLQDLHLLETRLKERLPRLKEEFKAAIESLGMVL